MNKKILIISLIIVAVLVIGFFVGRTFSKKNVEGELASLMTKVYQNVPENERPMMLANTEVTSENAEYYLGSKDIQFEKALASEPQIGSIPHSVVLVRAKDGQNVNQLMTTIKEKINPRKWICVGVEKEDVIVANNGNLVILIMTNEHANTLLNSFKKLR